MQSLRVQGLGGARLCKSRAVAMSAHAKVATAQRVADVTAVTVATTLPSFAYYQAIADELTAEAPGSAVSPTQAVILLAPVILYGMFTVYRTTFNRGASIGDFFFFVVAAVVIGNIGAIVFFKTRLF